MPLFHVEWSVEVDADSHEEAAKQARAMQLDPASIATVFSVRQYHSIEPVSIDLSPEEGV